MTKIPSCYHCKYWDADYAKPGSDGELYAYCDNPEKVRPETGCEPCPCTFNDFCMGFEPVEGWTEEWRLAMHEKCGDTEGWLEEIESCMEDED